MSPLTPLLNHLKITEPELIDMITDEAYGLIIELAIAELDRSQQLTDLEKDQLAHANGLSSEVLEQLFIAPERQAVLTAAVEKVIATLAQA